MLDCACGEGYYTAGLYQTLTAAGKTPSVAGIDISKFALRRAAKQVPQGEFAVASVYHLPLAEESVDVITNVFSPSRSIIHPQLAVNALESAVGLITPTTPRCPHLGCALKYNKAEHSWDCPCHGSRFSENGELIDNPATDDKI